MLGIDELLSFYRERLWEQPPPSELPATMVVRDTIAYLTGYKQLRLMMIDLGKAKCIDGLEQAMEATQKWPSSASTNPGGRPSKTIESARNSKPGGDNKGKRRSQ